MELINQLVSTLGIDSKQAEGGTGLLMKLVKDNLSGADFSRITNAAPQLEGLMQQAPEGGAGGSLLGMAGGLLSSMGSDKLAGLTQIAGGLQSLNLNKDTLVQFIPVILQHFQKQGQGDIAGLIQKALPF